jgi:hypothetical protein
MRATRALIGLVLAGVAVAALAAPASAAARNMTARQVAARLVPLGCRAKPPAPGSTELGVKPVAELVCKIRGETVTIDQYRSTAQAAVAIAFARSIGCQVAKEFGVNNFPFVYGANWTVSTRTLATARAVARAIGDGAKVSVIRC